MSMVRIGICWPSGLVSSMFAASVAVQRRLNWSLAEVPSSTKRSAVDTLPLASNVTEPEEPKISLPPKF